MTAAPPSAYAADAGSDWRQITGIQAPKARRFEPGIVLTAAAKKFPVAAKKFLRDHHHHRRRRETPAADGGLY
ncbi:MAG: hypothetical protein IT536_10895 [Hyphomicrobiales bacterium]|nr:hypothetical protein [Hyphomicrobiales bacterium]